MYKRLISFLVFVLFANSSFAEENVFIGNVMSKGVEPRKVVFVDKGTKTLYLLEMNGSSQTLLQKIPVLTGLVDGSKQVRGDEKTPEGVYYITSYKSPESMQKAFGAYAATYGTGAFPLNYPNAVDRIMKRTGSGIWLHGLNPDRHKPATEGCVAMDNGYLDGLKPYLSIGGAVVIVDNATFLNEAEYSEYSEKSMRALDSFIEAWGYGDFETFKKQIHPDYSSYSASTAKAYLSKKESLMKSYPNRYISTDNVSIYKQNNELLVYDFNQFYCADNLVSYGNKKIYLLPDEEGDYKVISEEMSAASPKHILDKSVNEFLSQWLSVWSSKDINGYLSYYDDAFPALGAWKTRKAALFDTEDIFEIEALNISWEQAGANKIKVTFVQKYKAGAYSDEGIKTMLIKGCPGSYKIISEDWRAR